MRHFIFLFLFLPVTFGLVSAQKPYPAEKKAEIKGQVLDFFSRKPIEARIIAELQPNDNEVVISKTDALDGSFSFQLKRKSTYRLKIQMQGYLSFSTLLKTDEDSSWIEPGRKTIELIPVKQNSVLPFEHILFDVNNFQLSQHSLPELEKLSALLIANPGLVVRLEGHTDNVGKSKTSMLLAKKRIKSIERYLESKNIPASQIRKKAFAGQNPLSLGDSYDAHRLNRRVEVRVLKFELQGNE